MSWILNIMVLLSLSLIHITTQSYTKPHSLPFSITSTIRRGNPKTLKRSTTSPLLDSLIEPRILSKKPVNVLQNGPYFINHYIYCDNFDKNVLQQIKAGTISSEKALDLLNFNKNHLHTLNNFKSSLNSLSDFSHGVFSANKEIHILDLPKQGPQDGFNSHFPESPPIDLELNQNFHSFDVELGGVTPPNPSSSLEFIKPLTTETVEPLLQGEISTGFKHKFNHNLDQLVHYLNENVDAIKDETGDVVINPQGEHFELPHFENHPLEHDHTKSSYDTAGAVDSYGHPITPSSIDIASSHPHDLLPFASNAHQRPFASGFAGELEDSDSSDIIKHFDELNNLQKNRQGHDITQTLQDSAIDAKQLNQSEVRYSNHKYD